MRVLDAAAALIPTLSCAYAVGMGAVALVQGWELFRDHQAAPIPARPDGRSRGPDECHRAGRARAMSVSAFVLLDRVGVPGRLVSLRPAASFHARGWSCGSVPRPVTTRRSLSADGRGRGIR